MEPVNAASLISFLGWFAPGNVLTIFGNGLGPETTAEATPDSYGDMPKELAGTRLLLNERPIPLLSVGATRIEAVAPFAANRLARWRVERNGAPSNTVVTIVRETTPGLFALDGSGTGRALAVHRADDSLNGPQNPVAKGSILDLYATGLGHTDPPSVAGRVAAADALPAVRAPVSVIVGNRAAEVLYAGGAPGQAAGITQVTVRIGESTPSGPYIPIRLIVGDGIAIARQELTIAVE